VHRGTPNCSMRVRFPCQNSVPARVLSVVDGLQAEGLPVQGNGAAQCVVICRVVAAACPVSCVTVKLTGAAVSRLTGTVEQLLAAAGYDTAGGMVLQEFMGATQLGRRTVANPSVVLGYVVPPAGDEGLMRLPTVIPGLGNPAFTKVQVVGGEDLARVRAFAARMGAPMVSAAGAVGVARPHAPLPSAAGNHVRPAQPARGDGAERGTGAGRQTGHSIQGAGHRAQETTTLRGPARSSGGQRPTPMVTDPLPLPPPPVTGVMPMSASDLERPQMRDAHMRDVRTQSDAPQGSQASTRRGKEGKRQKVVLQLDEALRTPLAGVMTEWVRDAVGGLGLEAARDVVADFCASQLALIARWQHVGVVGDIPKSVTQQLSQRLEDMGMAVPSGYGGTSSEGEADQAGCLRRSARVAGVGARGLQANAWLTIQRGQDKKEAEPVPTQRRARSTGRARP
jgi:hypothetical protein